uniref:Migration and invasion-inhibitory protein isoform X1 n=2 Tax=Pogona vitticeps TaxID=103695 RepID=A0ABM5EKC5_9SAUR
MFIILTAKISVSFPTLGAGGDKMDLAKLRQLNQELLQKLRTNQEEFRRRIQTQPALPSSQSERTTLQDGPVLESEDGKENQNWLPEEGPDVAMPAESQRRVTATGSGPRSPSKPIPSCSKEPTERPRQRGLHPGSSNAEGIFAPSPEAPRGVRERRRKGDDTRTQRRRGKPSESGKIQASAENSGPEAGEEPDEPHADRAGQARTSARMPPGPKSILLTPRGDGAKEKTKKEAGHVTFVSDPEEHTIPAGDWSIRPFLGYDWIAGILETNSSISEKPEQYFEELQDFRRVNRDDCISDRDSPLDGLGSLGTDREPDLNPASHQCVFCYRLNKRLFAEPLDPESACPMCKTPRTQKPPETLVEPAFVRVSIPRSTLLPAYKHKIHRRKSYEVADNLALPSHCVAGWENPVWAPSPTLSSLDLRSFLDGKPPNQVDQNPTSRISGGTKTDRLLDVSRAAAFELGTLPRQWRCQKLPS